MSVVKTLQQFNVIDFESEFSKLLYELIVSSNKTLFIEGDEKCLIDVLRKTTGCIMSKTRLKVLEAGGNSSKVHVEKCLYFSRDVTQQVYSKWKRNYCEYKNWRDDTIFNLQVDVISNVKFGKGFFSNVAQPAIEKHQPKVVFFGFRMEYDDAVLEEIEKIKDGYGVSVVIML